MTLSEISIRRPVFAWMLMAGLIIFGAISFLRMGVSQLPDVDFPVVSINLTLEGAAPEVMETDVVDPVEDAVMTVQGVRNVSSHSRNGAASVSIEFDLQKNIDAALQEVQNRLLQAQRVLPREMDPPVVLKVNPEDNPIMWVTLSSEKHSLKELMLYVRDRLKDEFSTVPGVGDVFLGGYVDPNMRIWISNQKLQQYALTVGDITATIRNEHSELPGGRIETREKEYNVRILGEADTPEKFENLIISQRGGQPNYVPIRLGEVARIEDGLADVRRLSRAMGKQAVGMGIRKQRNSNAVEVAENVRKKMDEVRPTLPEGMNLWVNFDATRFIREAVGELNFTLVLSALLTSLVCWLFLGSWTSTLNVLLAIPTSIIGTFIILYFSKFTLNTFTLLGLSLAIGIVVDDAIMVLENIVRHREKGEGRVEAALKGSREITFAAIASTISVVAIFAPVAFMKGAIGEFFYQFGITMTAAVLLSLLEALTLTPMRCAAFVEAGERRTRLGRSVEAAFRSVAAGYRRWLETALHHRWKVLGGSMVFFVCSFALVKFINKEFAPKQDQSMFLARFQTPVGSSIQFTDGKMREMEKFLGSRPEVLRYFVAVGGFGGGEVNTGIAFVTLKPKRERDLDQFEFMDVAREAFNKVPDVKVTIQDLSMRGFSSSRGFPIEFAVQGPDWDTLAKYGQEIMKRLNETGLVSDLDTDYMIGMPEVQITPDRAAAAAHGVSVLAIGETINALVGGQVVGKYPKGGHRYDIRVRLDQAERDTADEIRNLYVRNNRGELIGLFAVVKIAQKPTLQLISRRDRERAVSIFGNVASGKSQQDALDAVERIGKEILPSGYHVTFTGSAQSFKESFQGLIFALLLGIVVAYMVLASQFNSFIHPVTVLMALPFSISGAFISLLVGGQSLNIYSLNAIILLMGIVKKNSILLVDFTNQIRARGVASVHDALLEACPIRLRPILMTSLATIAGALPPALAVGPGAETRIPMATAVIGGMVVSTALTLFVVPCVYSLFSRLERSRPGAGRGSLPSSNPGLM